MAWKPTLAAVVLTAALTGCADLQGLIGLGKTSPDEFAVVRHAALAVPPDYQLRPPKPGAARPQEVASSEVARRALLGQTGTAPRAPTAAQMMPQTPGERSLLRAAGAGEVPVNIREVVRIESASLGVQDRSFTDSLLFWKGTDQEGEVLDPVVEAERLRRENKQGAVMAPSVPESGITIERQKGGFLGNLF